LAGRRQNRSKRDIIVKFYLIYLLSLAFKCLDGKLVGEWDEWRGVEVLGYYLTPKRV
jgi:hypothetical protein